MSSLEKHVTEAVGEAQPGAAIPFELIIQIITALMGFIQNCPFGGARRAMKAGSTEATVAAYHAVKKSGYSGNAVDLARLLVERGKNATDAEVDETLQMAASMPSLSKLLMIAVMVLGLSASAIAGPFPEAASGPFPVATLKGGDLDLRSPPVQVGEPTEPGSGTPRPDPVSVVTIFSPSSFACSYCEAMKAKDWSKSPFRVEFKTQDGFQKYPRTEWTDANGTTRYLEGYHSPWQVEWAWKKTGADQAVEQTAALAVDDAAPTPYAEIVKALALLPEPKVGFVVFGSGADGRWEVAAAEKWDCKITGIEIDPERAAEAQRHVAELGLSDRIEIIEGDALTAEYEADVGAAYLYPQTLELLKPRIQELTAFVSYMHNVPNVTTSRSGDNYVYRKPVQVEQYAQQQRTAVYGGYTYQYGYRGCGNSGCEMCNSILRQLYGQ